MSETDFHDQVLQALSDLKVGLAETNAELRAVVARLDKHAAAIAQHQIDIGKLQIEIAERRNSCPLASVVADDLVTHITGCPLRGRMDAVEEFVANSKAMAKANDHWLNRLWPVFYAAAGIAVYMLAMHANELLKAMSAAK